MCQYRHSSHPLSHIAEPDFKYGTKPALKMQVFLQPVKSAIAAGQGVLLPIFFLMQAGRYGINNGRETQELYLFSFPIFRGLDVEDRQGFVRLNE